MRSAGITPPPVVRDPPTSAGPSTVVLSFFGLYDTIELDQQIVVTGRLDSIYEPTLTGYQPIVSIIANRIITLHGASEQVASVVEQLRLA